MERLTDEEIMQELDDIWVFGEEPTDRQRIAANQAIHLIKELAELKEIRTLKKPTNGDYIRSMTDKELADYLVSIEKDTINGERWECEDVCLTWLKQVREDKE